MNPDGGQESEGKRRFPVPDTRHSEAVSLRQTLDRDTAQHPEMKPVISERRHRVRLMDKEKEKGQPELGDIPSIENLQVELARVESGRNFRKALLNIAGILIVVAALAALAVTRIFVLIKVNGSSMSPTFEANEVIFLHQTEKIEAGDIIGFYYGGNIFLKRVIGTSGDKIEIDKKGSVYVNDELLEEPYLEKYSLGKCEIDFPYQVPDGMYFVLGDNRAVSLDSRIKSIGCVQSEQIVGKAVVRVWPFTRMGRDFGAHADSK